MSSNEISRMKIISATAVLTTEEAPAEEAAPVDGAGAVAEETTPAAETPSEETPAAEEGADKPAVPEEYTDFTLPEGVSADGEVIDEFKPLAKELGLPQDQAQKVVDLGAKLVQRTLDGIIAQHQERVSAWIKEAEADKEIGEDVKRGKESATLRAFNTLIEGDERVKQMVDETGVGNHPEFLRIFYRLSQRMREDTFDMPGTGGAKSFQDKLNMIYPNTKD